MGPVGISYGKLLTSLSAFACNCPAMMKVRRERVCCAEHSGLKDDALQAQQKKVGELKFQLQIDYFRGPKIDKDKPRRPRSWFFKVRQANVHFHQPICFSQGIA